MNERTTIPRRKPRAPEAPALPVDVRLMRIAANLLFVLVGVALVAGALLWVVRAPAFAIRGVDVDGELMHNSVTSLAAGAAAKVAGSYFTLDLQKSRAMFETVPWVRHAVVRRVWPNRLQVTLEEHRPAALWHRDDGDDQLVNTHGEVFEVNLGDVDEDALPTLAGPTGSAATMLEAYRRLAPQIEPLGQAIETLSLSERGSWQITLANGAELELGRGSADELAARTQRFVATLPQITERLGRGFARADLRHRDGYALRLAAPLAAARGAVPPSPTQ